MRVAPPEEGVKLEDVAKKEIETQPRIEISEIDILPVRPDRGLVAYVSFVLNGCFFVGNVGIHAAPNGLCYRLVYPEKYLPNGKKVSCFHPIRKDTGLKIQHEVTKEYCVLLKRIEERENELDNRRDNI